METLAVGIIGFGRIGNEHASWLSQCACARPVAVADATAARRAKASEQGLKVFETPEQLLREGKIDAVLIATPTAMHCDHALAALSAGKHVMIEKPMALDLAESKRIVTEADRQKRMVSVFHNRRWDADYLTVKAAVASGVLGRVINVESRLGQWASCVGPAAKEYRPNWRNEAAFGGGALYDWGSHFVDQLWRLFYPAKPTHVFSQLRGNVWSKDTDDFARICINFDNGAVGLVEINTTTIYPLPRWHIDGTLGSAESPCSLEFDVKTWSQLKFSPAQEPTAARLIPASTEGMSEIQIWERFTAAIAGNGEPAVSIASVLPTMVLLDAARQSSETQMSIPILNHIPWIL
jgi:scyllo-inositol 2-dehydrogenase (NADP+)